MWFVVSLDTMELYQRLAMQYLEKELARYGLTMCTVKEMKFRSWTVITADGESTITIGIIIGIIIGIMTLALCADPQVRR